MIEDDIFLNSLIDNQVYSTSVNKIYRRAFLSDNNIFFPSLRANEDIYYSRAVSFYAKKTCFVSKVYYHALVRPGSTSRSISSQMFLLTDRLLGFERVAFHSLICRGRFEVYFGAHFVKLFSYLLVQAAFRIQDQIDYKFCCHYLEKSEFYVLASRSDVRTVLGFKNRVMIRLCFYPRLLRALAVCANKVGLGSIIY